jgi:chromosome segregation ATPase
MNFVTRGVVRWGLISGLALGGLVLVFGHQPVIAGLSAVRAKAQGVADSLVDNPTALRRQLSEMADQYPDRIAEVRGELAQVNSQIDQFHRDCEVSRRVISLASEDLTQLKDLITRAETEIGAASGGGGVRAVAVSNVIVRFEGTRFDLDEAYQEAHRINEVRLGYSDRLATNEHHLQLLTEQKTRLIEIQNKLESEYATFQTQLWQLDRQIDAIERNERLITMTEEMQNTLEDYSKFERVGNLKQLESKLAELRMVQQAQLEQLQKRSRTDNYEDRARSELHEIEIEDPFQELEPVGTQPGKTPKIDPSLAFRMPIIIE